MPLGVFALTPDGQKSGPDPTLFLQLAISKEGIISGTLNNSATEQDADHRRHGRQEDAALRLGPWPARLGRSWKPGSST